MEQKFIFVTGGVVSSLGKGLTCGSIAALLEGRGLKVGLMKLDPYLNVDPGTMNPYQHGEVYVTDDGTETDLDLGHYYRYSSAPLSRHSSATSGQIYDTVIKRERRGDYLGNTVQVVPHITDEIKLRIARCGEKNFDAHVIIVEIGGTVGDIESLPFLEAIRQFRLDRVDQCMNIHLTHVPYLKAAGEVKTKPTQHSVGTLRQLGIMPDLILCRCEDPLSQEIKNKIALFCSVSRAAVIDEPDVEKSIYEVPLTLQERGMGRFIAHFFGLPEKKSDLSAWEYIVASTRSLRHRITIALVGKYVDHKDAYKSVLEALSHAAIAHSIDLITLLIDSERGEINLSELKQCQGVLVPGGFGERGFEGKVRVAKYCREQRIPYFGICLGMQVMAVDFARHVLGLFEANSTEMNSDTPHPIISLLSEQTGIEEMGGTMRLGAYECLIKPDTLAHKCYGKSRVSERHRHRYEFNNAFREMFEKKGFFLSGELEKNGLCEIAELVDHPWMLGVQFHPEFLSKPTTPHPLFLHFLKSAMERNR